MITFQFKYTPHPMKQTILSIVGLMIFHGMFSQSTQNPIGVRYANGTYFAQCTEFEISRPLRELAAENPVPANDPFSRKESDKQRTRKQAPVSTGLPAGDDPNVQNSFGVGPLGAPIQNWTGQPGNGGYPLDPTGAAGPTAYVQGVNTEYRAYSKTGTPLMGSLMLSSLWPGSVDDGDPIVLYDKYADRWFIQQFQQTGNKILIAISQTNDPTGAFYKYTFVPDAADFPDYPKLSIWTDGYYMCNNYSNEKVTAFDRTKMLAGNPAAGMIVMPLPNVNVPAGNFFCPMPADADGILPPSGTPISIFSFEDDNWGAPATKDQIHIIKMTTDWTTPANSTIAEDIAGGSPLAVLPFNSTWNNYMNEITQKGSTQGLDAIEGVFMYRAQFRRWVGYNTVVLNNAVNITPTTTNQSGIRWYELHQDPANGHWTLYQQGTYAPDGENRWMGSIAMDDNGSIGLAYAKSGTNTYPSLCYTGRYKGDPYGTMNSVERTAKAGTAAQSGANRWGDYAHTSLDPDGVTFWHTGMFMVSPSPSTGTRTQIYSFQIAGDMGIVENAPELAEFSAFRVDNSSLLVKGSKLSSNDELVVDLFDVDGKQISGKSIKPSANAFETNVSVTGLAKGIYLVRIGNIDFQKVIKVSLN
jgi:hypothetical protein